MNLRKVASDIAKFEVGKSESNIGDIREILRKLFTQYSLEDIVKIWLKYNK